MLRTISIAFIMFFTTCSCGTPPQQEVEKAGLEEYFGKSANVKIIRSIKPMGHTHGDCVILDIEGEKYILLRSGYGLGIAPWTGK